MPCGPGVRTDRLTGLNLTTGDVINAIRSQNVQAAVGRIGARPISDDQQLQLNIQTKGRLASVQEFGTSSCAPTRTGRCCACATSPGSNWEPQNLDRETRLNGGAAAGIAIYPVARGQCHRDAEIAVKDKIDRSAKSASRKIWPGR